MNKSGLARLTDGQRACLRLVYMHKSSKDIARELGISPHTVDQRLKVAIQLLDADNRFDAACFLAWHEGVEGYQSLIYQRPDVAAADGPLPKLPPIEYRGAQQPGMAMREQQLAFKAGPFGATARPLPLPDRGEKSNDLTVLQKLGWIIAVAIFAALSFGALLAGLDALSRLT